ncbi:MAG: HDOD domain-containing protein [Thioalkalispiraceae bacterium]|jgi:HD-like signal output (HDOD) protein
MPTSIDDIISQVDDLVSLPGVFLRINEMIESQESTAAEIGAVLSQDPGLTARLLRIANSPFYGLSKEVDSVSRAITIIGTQRLRDLVLATCAVEAFDGIPNELITMDDFWGHSLYCGLISKQLGELAGLRESDSLFIAGLLHDIGRLIMFRELPVESLDVLLRELDQLTEPDMSETEAEIIGFDHAQLGGAVIAHWHLPAIFVEPISLHHQPEKATEFPRHTAIVHIANTLAVLAELNTLNMEETDAPSIHSGSWETIGVSPDVIQTVVTTARQEFESMRSLFLPKAKKVS